MKIFGEGALVDQRDACMKFAQGLEFLDAMTIGFEKPEQIDDTLRQEQPVNPAEARHLDILRRAAKEVEARPLEAQQAQFAHWLCMAYEAGMHGYLGIDSFLVIFYYSV